jgi:hypothetical protein
MIIKENQRELLMNQLKILTYMNLRSQSKFVTSSSQIQITALKHSHSLLLCLLHIAEESPPLQHLNFELQYAEESCSKSIHIF